MDNILVTLRSSWGFHAKAIHCFAARSKILSPGVNGRSKSMGLIKLIRQLNIQNRNNENLPNTSDIWTQLSTDFCQLGIHIRHVLVSKKSLCRF